MASQTLTSSMQPTDVYGGDEVAAIILDPGYSSIRAGFAGEDTPKSVVNSYYGVAEGKRLVFGDDSIHNPLAGLEIKNPLSKDGTIEDWDVATHLMEYSITSRLTSLKQSDPRTNGLNDDIKDGDIEMDGEEGEKPLEEHPLLMTEPAWNSAKNREKAIEIAMENWGCPAFWLSRSSVLAAFGNGRSTALVIDVGASTASVIAIHDGLILKKSSQKSHLAGNWVSSQIRTLFSTQDTKVDLVPHYMIASKTPVDANTPAQAKYRKYETNPTESFRALEEERVLTEFKESVVQIWSGGNRLSTAWPNGTTNLDAVKSTPGRVFEMPNGANQMWGAERFTVAEGLFDEKAALGTSDPAITRAHTITEMVRQSLNNVDVDMRPILLGNIVVVGGTTLINGFTDRLNSELAAIYSGVKIRIQAPGLTSERRFGTWIGGSILGSLGTFHQMWISRKEYEEFGVSIVEKRCK